MEEISMDVTTVEPEIIEPVQEVPPLPPPSPPAEKAEAEKPKISKKKKDEAAGILLDENDRISSSARTRQRSEPNLYRLTEEKKQETVLARPVGGFVALENYLDSAWQTGKMSDSFSLPGSFIGLEFQVQQNGTLSNFLVTQSINPNRDSSLIRLLKNGPKWEFVNPLQQQPVKVNYRFPKNK